MTTESAPPDQGIGEPPAHTPPSPRGRRFLAGCASLLLPGLGHVLAGRWRRGVVWFAICVCLWLLIALAMGYASCTPALVVLLPISILLVIWIVIDACITAGRSGSRMLGRPAIRYVAAGIILAIVVAGQPGRVVGLVIRHYWAQAFSIPTATMVPALNAGDHILASRLEPFSRWSIVVFRSPEDGHTFYVKRIAGLPGETIEIKQGHVLINGHRIPEPADVKYIGDAPLIQQGGDGQPMKLGADEYFVLGDNSRISRDSRYWTHPAPGHQPGALPANYIIGPVTWIYWPISHIKRLDRASMSSE